MTIEKNGWRVLVNGFTINEEQTKTIEEMMECAKIFAENMEKLSNSIPDGYQHQFFGNWNILVIKKVPEREDYQFD